MPVAIELGVDLLVLCGLLVLIGLTKGLQYSLVAVLKALAGAVGHVPLIGGWVASHLDHLSHWLYNQLGVGILHMEHAGVWFFHNLAVLARELAEAIEATARLIEHAVAGLIAVHLPRWSRTLLRLLQHQIARLARRLHAIERAAVHDVTKAAAKPWPVLHDLHRDVVRGYEAMRHAIAVTLPAEIAGLRSEVADVVGYTRRNLLRRIRRLEYLIAGGLLAAIALKMIERIAPWARCANVNRVGRKLCRFPVQALEQLLEGGLEVLAFADLCAITRLVAGTAAAIRPVLQALVAIEGAALCNGEHSAAPALPLNAAALPLATNPLPL